MPPEKPKQAPRQDRPASLSNTDTDISGVPKLLSFLGSSLEDLRAFPEAARREAGYQIHRVQQGLNPDSWKPMTSVGGGVREIRVRDHAGAFRVIYIATRAEAVYVLHAFQKKTQATPKHELDLAEARLKELTRSAP